MKKSLCVLGAAIFCFCSNSAICGTEETFTYGTPPSSSGGGFSTDIDSRAMTQHMIWEIQHAQAVQAGRSVYEQIKEQRRADEKKSARRKW